MSGAHVIQPREKWRKSRSSRLAGTELMSRAGCSSMSGRLHSGTHLLVSGENPPVGVWAEHPDERLAQAFRRESIRTRMFSGHRNRTKDQFEQRIVRRWGRRRPWPRQSVLKTYKSRLRDKRKCSRWNIVSVAAITSNGWSGHRYSHQHQQKPDEPESKHVPGPYDQYVISR